VSRRVVLIGGGGQLAHDLRRHWAESRGSEELVPLSHANVEVADLESVRAALGLLKPDLVINTSAYHKVDVVEDDPERAFAVNAVGPRNLALACRDLDAVLVHLSTDYVFSGRTDRPYVETDPVDPLNVYGVSKAAGEMLVRHLWPRHFIVRSSGLYGQAGSSGKAGNFVETMLRLAAGDRPIRVVSDQVLTPTGTPFLAGQLAELSATDRYGTYHATCQGECSWYDFAAAIFELAGVRPVLQPQSTAESGARALRPPYSVLENRALAALGLDRMPPWQESLRAYLEARTRPQPAREPA
jgi:dTDP-4-dehydrorhamnose reductase